MFSANLRIPYRHRQIYLNPVLFLFSQYLILINAYVICGTMISESRLVIKKTFVLIQKFVNSVM